MVTFCSFCASNFNQMVSADGYLTNWRHYTFVPQTTIIVLFRDWWGCITQELFANLLMSLSNSSFFSPFTSTVWMWQVHTVEWCMETSAKWDFIIPAVAVLWIWIDLSDIHLHLPSVFQHNAENYLSAPLSVHTLEDLGNSGLSQLIMDTFSVG